MKELITRTISGLIGVALLIFVTLKGGLVLNSFILIISLIGLYEIFNALTKINLKPVKIIGYLFTVGLFLYSLDIKYITLDFLVSFSMILLLLMLVLSKNRSFSDIVATLFSILYVPFFMFHITYLNGTKYIWLIFITAWGTDTFAYIFGNLFGKRKLCPKLSPNKTIEGSLGGILGSVILTLLFVNYENMIPCWKFIILSIICSVAAQFGDLTASRIKRITGIKDYGYIMPGHGGIMDRFDSILFTAPVVYYYIKLFIIHGSL